MHFPIAALKKWFLEERRSFPWRESPTPYAVWISEVMLQQTQAKVVIPYFKRWMEKFPTISDLAKAPLEEVIKLWEGLGYYSRARNLHEGAKVIVEEFAGTFPIEGIEKIKGIGPYTRGAILSFAFHKKAAAVDGNVLRLLSRFYAIEEPIDEAKTQKIIWDLTEKLLPEDEPWIISEALIECGATICQKEPLCYKCPLLNECEAYQKGVARLLPKKKKTTTITHLHRIVGIIIHQGNVLVKKGERGRVMGELYEFPYSEKMTLAEGKQELEKVLGIPLTHMKELPQEVHSFTRYKAVLYPHLFHTKSENVKGYEWRRDLMTLPFSSGHRRILHHLVQHENFTH